MPKRAILSESARVWTTVFVNSAQEMAQVPDARSIIILLLVLQYCDRLYRFSDSRFPSDRRFVGREYDDSSSYFNPKVCFSRHHQGVIRELHCQLVEYGCEVDSA